MKQRAEVIDRIAAGSAAGSYDVCVIGGGASRPGCALDAQLRGLKTVLVDRGDFGNATSTASTKLIHGGLRYLQLAVRERDFAQYRVVRTALRERSVMMKNAPFLTRSRALAVPCHSIAQAMYSRVGVRLYDWLSGSDGLSPSRFLDRSASVEQMPWLKPDGLFGSVIYSDGQFDDARYDLALIQSFVAAGGDALNYASIENFEKSDQGAIVAADVCDVKSGISLKMRARSFVNATGPFSDRVRCLANSSVPGRLRQSKGVHILLPLRSEWTNKGLLIPDTEDERVIFAIPWMGRLLVGTTETEVGTCEEMIVREAEAKFLLRHLNKYLLQPFQLGDIVAAIAGMRPLIRSGDPRDSKKIARDYEIEVEAQTGLISVLGGKWTVYRAMAEDAIDVVEKRLRGARSPCRTHSYPLYGADRSPDAIKKELLANYAVNPSTIDHLISKFGSAAIDVLELTREKPQWSEPIVEGASDILAEVVYAARNEMVVNLADLLDRRLGVAMFDWQLAFRAAPVAAQLLARELGWTSSRLQEEIHFYSLRIQKSLNEIGQSQTMILANS